MRRLTAALLLLAVPAEAQPPSTEAIQNATVRIDVNCTSGNPEDRCWGAGTVVQNDPVVIATCYHVIRDRRSVKVHAPAFANELPEAQVSSVAIDPVADLAFLRLKIHRWPSRPLSWAAVSGAAAAPTKPLRFAGASNYEYPNGFLVAELGYLQQLPLELLGGPKKLKTIGPLGNVVELDTAVHPGDSGAAVFDATGRIIGLVSGRVKQSANDKLRHFAVRATFAIPEPTSTAWVSLPVDEKSIFTNELQPYVASLVGGPELSEEIRSARGSFTPVVAGCLPHLETLLRTYKDRRHELPPNSDLGECSHVYAAIRSLLVEQEAAEFAADEAQAIARTLDVGAETLKSVNVEVDLAPSDTQSWGWKSKTKKLLRGLDFEGFAMVLSTAKVESEQSAVKSELKAAKIRQHVVETLQSLK